MRLSQNMHLSWRHATEADLPILAEWNHQLIRDEGHRNPMTVDQLATRMKTWLEREYHAVVFLNDTPVSYALFKDENEAVHLRQFFVRRDRRRDGVGRASFEILRKEIWPAGVRLTVDVLCRNTDATAFWRSVGYKDYCLTLEINPR
jgi:GNAT superfamily N-acetyltransferase